jgi:hypothetical protein
MMLRRILEFLPLALVLGTSVAALRHRSFRDIQRSALGNTGRILLWLVVGAAAIEIGLRLLVRD